jgi:RNA polymerase sigma factor (sigma-70 family)
MGRKPSRDRHSDADDPTPPAEPERTREGRRPMSAEQQRLVIHYLPMARAMARPLKATWPGDGNEFESAACMALVEAAQSFDASRNVKFATFARYRIMGALRDAQRMIITGGWKDDAKYTTILTNCFPDVEEMGKVLGGAQDPPIGSDLEAIDAVEGWLRKLPPQHARAFRHMYVHGKTQGQTAELLGCSKSRISYLHKEALKMLNDVWHDTIDLEKKKGLT